MTAGCMQQRVLALQQCHIRGLGGRPPGVLSVHSLQMVSVPLCWKAAHHYVLPTTDRCLTPTAAAYRALLLCRFRLASALPPSPNP